MIYLRELFPVSFNRVKWILKTFAIIILFIIAFAAIARAETIPANLWQGLIAEDASGNYQTYLAISSCVRNRLQSGMNTGLVALKRKNLNSFVQKERAYASQIKKVDLKDLADKALQEVFVSGKEYSNKATHYEHTGKYPTPYWAKKMQVAKVMHRGTKEEITFYKGAK